MLCGYCRSRMEGLSEIRESEPRRTSVPVELSTLLCGRCGTVLPVPDPDGGMLTKLNQLSGFGLGADDRPLLASNDPSD